MAAPRKTPQDHKEPAAEAQVRFEDIEGHELLTPLAKVKGSDQTRLMARLQALGIAEERDDADLDAVDLDAAADLIDYVGEKFAVDPAAFEEFTCGPGGMERSLNLVMGYVAEMGKGAA